MINNFKYYSEDKELFEKYIKKYIPDKVIDFHVHLWRKKHINESAYSINNTGKSFLTTSEISGFAYQDFVFTTKTIFPQIDYTGVFFGNVFKEVNISEVNEMIREDIINKGLPGLFIPTANDDYNSLKKILKNGKYFGLKPYPDLAIGKDYSNQNSVSISDFLTEDHLKIANEMGLIILLHIPKTKRLNDKDNLRDIKDISISYPKTKLILAHAGRSYCAADLINSIKIISKLKNVYMDTAMITNWKVIELLLNNLGTERILYGSDLPVAGHRGKNICINGKHYFVTPFKSYWSISNENLIDSNFTFFYMKKLGKFFEL